MQLVYQVVVVQSPYPSSWEICWLIYLDLADNIFMTSSVGKKEMKVLTCVLGITCTWAKALLGL